MTRYIAFDSETEIVGFSTMALITNIQHHDIAPILKKHGLDDIDPSHWYPIQGVLDVFNDMAAQPNATLNLVSVGMAVAKQGLEQMSEDVKATPFETFMLSYPKLYQTRVRGGDTGEFIVEKISDSKYLIKMRIPFPDDLFYGTLYGYIRHFCPADKRFSLRYDPNLPRHDDGAEFTVMHLELT